MVDRQRPWDLIAVGLAAASVVVVGTGWLTAYSYTGSGGTAAKVAYASFSGATVEAALAVLLAAALNYTLRRGPSHSSRLLQQSRALAVTASLLMVLESAYVMVYAAVTHEGGTYLGINKAASRLALGLHSLPTLVLAGLAALLIVRPKALVEPRTPRERVPLRRKDWPDPWASDRQRTEADRT